MMTLMIIIMPMMLAMLVVLTMSSSSSSSSSAASASASAAASSSTSWFNHARQDAKCLGNQTNCMFGMQKGSETPGPCHRFCSLWINSEDTPQKPSHLVTQLGCPASGSFSRGRDGDGPGPACGNLELLEMERNTLPPINMEPDVRKVLVWTIFLLKKPPVIP